jgi:hypothetical protein
MIPPAAGEIRLTGTADQCRAHLDDVRALVEKAGAVPVTVGELETLAAAGDLKELLEKLRAAGAAAIASAAIDLMSEPSALVRTVLDAGLTVSRFVVQGVVADSPFALFDRVRDLQRATRAVRVFAPLPRHVDPAHPTTGYWDSKVIAVARLALHDVDTIQVDWSLYGPKLAQVGLLFGANDVDAVSPGDDAGAGRRRAPVEEIVRNIRAASLEPVERDGVFRLRPEA